MKKTLYIILFILILFIASCSNKQKVIEQYQFYMKKDLEYISKFEETEKLLYEMEINNKQDLNDYKDRIENDLISNLKKSLSYLKSINISSKHLCKIHEILILSRENLVKSYFLYISELNIKNFKEKQEELKLNLQQVETLEKTYKIQLNEYLFQ
ncbi:hypothetical protein KAU33_01410 [Candidatus Dependentiae bacterium]|nr:hypothetical protein [Candidatus Dependentiae bacterium]